MTAYEQGFLDKCAEAGVDPAALVKIALKFRSACGGVPSEKEVNGLHNFLARYGVTHKEHPKNIKAKR